MMVRIDQDLARAAMVHGCSVGPEEGPCRPDDETDFLCWTPKGPVRISPQKKQQVAEIMHVAGMVPGWLAALLRDGTTISMSRDDFYGLPDEVRRYVEVL